MNFFPSQKGRHLVTQHSKRSKFGRYKFCSYAIGAKALRIQKSLLMIYVP